MQDMSLEVEGRNSAVIKVTLNPNLRKIHQDIVNGQKKYAPKYAADNPAALVGLISSRL